MGHSHWNGPLNGSLPPSPLPSLSLSLSLSQLLPPSSTYFCPRAVAVAVGRVRVGKCRYFTAHKNPANLTRDPSPDPVLTKAWEEEEEEEEKKRRHNSARVSEENNALNLI